MRRISVIDAETDPFRKGRIPRPFIWGYYDGRDYVEFSTSEALADFLRGEYVICYAHNGGRFDFHFLLSELEPYAELTIINGRIARMFIGACELRDSICILPVPLAAYQKDKIDYAIFEEGERDKPKNRRKISAYLQSDCLYLHQMVSAFIARFGDNLTQAGAAMKQWQKICKREEIEPADRTDQEFYDVFAPYYYGGRVQCFKHGIIDTRFRVYDINSAYPFAMLYLHPYSATYADCEGFLPDADFYRVRCVSAGAFPYRGEGGEGGANFGLTFPNDDTEREYTITKWEFEAALETKTIKNSVVLQSIKFTRRVTFQAYINQFWDERRAAKESGDELTSLFTKLLMNSLYGKWAANPENYANYIIVPPDQAAQLFSENSAYAFAGELGPWIIGSKPLEAHERRYYNVATGASITGFVRAMLWRAIHSSKGVLYCDTDSIACEGKGRSVHLGNALGQWKHEGDFDRAGIAGKKLYIFRGVRQCANGAENSRLYKTASKGVRLTHSELWRVARGGSVDYESEAPTFSVHKGATFTNRTVRKTA